MRSEGNKEEEKKNEVCLYGELNKAYEYINENLFGGKLGKRIFLLKKLKDKDFRIRGYYFEEKGERIYTIILWDDFMNYLDEAGLFGLLCHEAIHQWFYQEEKRQNELHDVAFKKKEKSIGIEGEYNRDGCVCVRLLPKEELEDVKEENSAFYVFKKLYELDNFNIGVKCIKKNKKKYKVYNIGEEENLLKTYDIIKNINDGKIYEGRKFTQYYGNDGKKKQVYELKKINMYESLCEQICQYFRTYTEEVEIEVLKGILKYLKNIYSERYGLRRGEKIEKHFDKYREELRKESRDGCKNIIDETADYFWAVALRIKYYVDGDDDEHYLYEIKNIVEKGFLEKKYNAELEKERKEKEELEKEDK